MPVLQAPEPVGVGLAAQQFDGLREARVTGADASPRPVAFHAAGPSTAQIVEWNDETRAPYSAQQFQAPSSSRAPASLAATFEPSWPK